VRSIRVPVALGDKLKLGRVGCGRVLFLGEKQHRQQRGRADTVGCNQGPAKQAPTSGSCHKAHEAGRRGHAPHLRHERPA
jgi:hypothetical protein